MSEVPTPSEENSSNDSEVAPFPVGRIITAGWACLAVSAIFLYLSHKANSDAQPSYYAGAFWLMFARLFGIGGFITGAVAIFNRWWTNGVFLLVLSLGLPFVAFFLHGTI